MANFVEFYTERDPSLRVAVSGKGSTLIFSRGYYRTNDPHEILTLRRHPGVVCAQEEVEIDLREPAALEMPEEEVLIPEGIRQCQAMTARGPCKIPAKEGQKYCHVLRWILRGECAVKAGFLGDN